MEFLKNIKLARVSTVIFFIDTQLNDQIKSILASGADVAIVSSEPKLNRPIPDAKYYSIEIARQLNLKKDLIALFRLYRLFKKHQFDIVHSTTPKAGFLCALAGFFAGVPIRLHTFTGQPWVTLSGRKQKLAIFADKFIGIFNTACYADSLSQKKFLVSKKIIKSNKISVLGKGSVSGVNFRKFNSKKCDKNICNKIKRSLKIPIHSIVIVFVGRIVKDKGAIELVKAFYSAFSDNPNIYLLFVGPQELSLKDLGVNANSSLKNRIRFTGLTHTPSSYLSISNFLCLPSYREGFGTVVLEAAAIGIPTIGSNIYGLSDAIVHGETGLLVEPKKIGELVAAMRKLVYDNKFCRKLGKNAYNRARNHFSSTKVNQKVILEYQTLLRKKGILIDAKK